MDVEQSSHICDVKMRCLFFIGRFAFFFLSIVFLSSSQGLVVATKLPLTKRRHHVTGPVISTWTICGGMTGCDRRQDVTQEG